MVRWRQMSNVRKMQSFRCPVELYEAMGRICEADETEYSDFICQALIMYTDYAERMGVLKPEPPTDDAPAEQSSAE